MRGSTVALAVIAVIAVGALFFSWRDDAADRPDSGRLAAAPAERPGQAQSRLDDLRNAYDRRGDGANEEHSLEERAAGSREMNEGRVRRSCSQRVAVASLQSGAGEHRRAACFMLRQCPRRQRSKPWLTVGVG